MVKLAQDVWEIYGLKGNPFDVRALSLLQESLLPISKAFVGRTMDSKESMLITNILRNPGGACFVVEGEIGVGKTSFLNYHRFLWENEARDKLFTPCKEIGVALNWSLKDFLMAILDSLISKVVTLRNAKNIMKNSELLQEILMLSKVYFGKTLQIEGGVNGFHLGIGQNETVSVPDVSETRLLLYFREMVNQIKRLGYAGVFLHFDNMELLGKQGAPALRLFLENIRDTLQTSDVYFAFVGYRGFFSDIIAPLQRVRSIFFGYPINLAPLSQQEVVEAIEKRYQLLAKVPSFIRPVENDLIAYLYNIFGGKIRFIMDAMNTLIPNFPLPTPTTLKANIALELLGKMAQERIANLTKNERRLLEFAATKEAFTNKQLCQRFKMPAPNIARVLKNLQNLNLVYIGYSAGKYTYYKVNEEIRVIPRFSNTQRPDLAEKIMPSYAKALQTLTCVANHSFQAADYQHATQLPPSTCRRYLKMLVDQGKLQRLGQGRATIYKLA